MKFFDKTYLFFQLVAFVFELWYLYVWLGGFGVVLGLFIFPAVWVALPFVMLFRSGIWLPLVITLLPFVIAIFRFNKDK